MMYRHPGLGDLSVVAQEVAEDARNGSLGRLTPEMAVEAILTRRKGWCVGKVGWTWVWFELYREAHEGHDNNEPGILIQLVCDAGRQSVWAMNDPGRMKKDWRGELVRPTSCYRYNWAQEEIDNSGPIDFVGSLVINMRDGHGYTSFSAVDLDLMLKMGVVPGQKVLIRGEGWSSRSYEGEYDAGYERDIVYIEPAEIAYEELAALIEEDQWPFRIIEKRRPL